MLNTLLPWFALLMAVWVDMRWGEPPVRIHPVVWIGHYLNWAAGVGFTAGPRHQFFVGILFWLLGASLVAACSILAVLTLSFLPWWGHCLGLTLLLKPSFSWGMLKREVLVVEEALAESLEAGRQRVSYLCSRDVSQLSAHQVRQTAIETLAENLNDSFVAPVFWFLIAGLPGAWVYRFSNTADAMWGYIGMRNGRDWTWFGKCAARVDDVLSYVPARITALLLWSVARSFSLRDLRHEARKTPSPNSGWPMAAMALALNVQLEKPNVYVLNPFGGQPKSTDTQLATRLATGCVFMALVGVVFLTSV